MRRALSLIAAVITALATLTVPAHAAVLLDVSGAGDAAGASWFVHPFEVTETGPITVTVDWADPEASVFVFLRAPDQPGNVTNDRSAAKPKTLVWDVQTTGTWEVAIKIKQGATDYTATATQDDPEPPPPPPPPPPGATVPADSPDGWWQTDDRVRDVLQVGDQVWITGHFTAIRPPGTPVGDPASIAEAGLAVLDATTGEPIMDTPDLDGNGWALTASLDGSTVYVGGTFLSVDGVQRKRLAAIDTATGTLTNWAPNTNSLVRALGTHPTTGQVIAGGQFDWIGGRLQRHLAAVDPFTGVTDAGFDPLLEQLEGPCPPRCSPFVDAIAFGNNGELYLGGHFGLVNGVARENAAAVAADDPSVTLDWDPQARTPNGRNPNQKGVVSEIAVPPSTSDFADRVVLCGDFYLLNEVATPNLAAVDATTGLAVPGWEATTDGGTPACVTNGHTVIAGGHFLKLGGPLASETGVDRLHIGAIDLGTGDVLDWNPSANSILGVHALRYVGDSLYVGGDFDRIGSTDQQGVARFGLLPR